MKALKILGPIMFAALLIAAFAMLPGMATPANAQAPVAEQITVPATLRR